ncbi:MAG: DUF975 family protein [Firmicutes bacterium]|nr:DUF975 family protein [Bacillota bacterium]
MTYNIVYERGRTIRSLARQSLRGEWLGALLVMIINYAVSNLPYMIVTFLTKSDFLIIAASVYSYMVAGPLSLGLAFYFLRVFRMQEHRTKLLFDGFSHFRNALGVYVMVMIRIFLWSFLFIIPGIIAAFRFSMAFFVLADDPEKDPLTCLRESDMMMRGNKTNLLYILAGFIGWYILASLPELFVENRANFTLPIARESIQSIIDTIVLGPSKPLSVLAGAGKILVQIYMYAAECCFYDLACGNLIIRQEKESESENEV